MTTTSFATHLDDGCQSTSSGLGVFTLRHVRYNEKHRLKERRLEFNMPALLKAAATSVNRQQDSLRSIRKLAEGGHNRIFELTMKDGFQMIARLPYPLTKPRALAIASEVATMDYLRGHGIPTPLVYSYSASANNPVGAEYILMEKIPGRCLGDVWFDVSDKQRVRILGDIVDQEANLFKISFPAYGSIYYDADLPEHMSRTMMERQFCIGPDVSLRHWFEARSELDIRRGSGELHICWSTKPGADMLHNSEYPSRCS